MQRQEDLLGAVNRPTRPITYSFKQEAFRPIFSSPWLSPYFVARLGNDGEYPVKVLLLACCWRDSLRLGAIAEGDKVVMRWSVEGTHQGEYQGSSPTGKKVSVGGTSTFRIADGMITEELVQWDALGFMQQLGAVPAEIEAVLQQQARFIETIKSADAEAIVNLADEAATDMAPGMPAAAGKAAFAERIRTILSQYRAELKNDVRQTDVSGDLSAASQPSSE